MIWQSWAALMLDCVIEAPVLSNTPTVRPVSAARWSVQNVPVRCCRSGETIVENESPITTMS